MKEPKKPKAPQRAGRPVVVRDYFKNGKRVKGYNRRRAGEGKSDEDNQKR